MPQEHLFDPFAQRQAFLKGCFSFDCICSACTESDHELSDKRRAELIGHNFDLPELGRWTFGLSTTDEEYYLRTYERLLDMTHQEGLEVRMRNILEYLLMSSSVRADEENTVKYGTILARYEWVRNGDESVNTYTLEEQKKQGMWGMKRLNLMERAESAAAGSGDQLRATINALVPKE